jgi:hypothetical protein
MTWAEQSILKVLIFYYQNVLNKGYEEFDGVTSW